MINGLTNIITEKYITNRMFYQLKTRVVISFSLQTIVQYKANKQWGVNNNKK